MSKHTPGPWLIKHHEGAINLFRLCNHQTANAAIREASHNRKLIEASPELLGSAKRFFEVMMNYKKFPPEDYESAKIELAKAIALAEGKAMVDVLAELGGK